MSVNHEIDYDALADKIVGDDFEPSGPGWSLIDVAEVRAYELLRREYADRTLQALADRPRPGTEHDHKTLVGFLTRCREDAEARLAAAKERALESGVPAAFVDSIISRDTIC